MANQVSAIREGIRYQDLYSWYEILLLLDENSPYEYAYLEHPDACSVDDLTLFPKKNAKVPAKYVQLKWRTRQAEICSFDSLIQERGGGPSWLRQLYDGWKKLRELGPVEVWLVSNWSLDPRGLGRFVRSRSFQILENLFEGSANSKAGRARLSWAKHLGTNEAELRAFCQDFRLHAGSSSIQELEEKIDDRMGRFGLRLGLNPRAIALDAIGSWIEIGSEYKKVTADDIRRMIAFRDLQARSDKPALGGEVERVFRKEPRVSIWIHGWTRQGFDLPPTEELDWTPFCDLQMRMVPTQKEWNEILFPQLRQVKERLADHTFIDFRGKLPLTAALAVGFSFPETAGYTLRTAQPTHGETFLWRTDAIPTNRTFTIDRQEILAREGREVLVAFSIVGDSRPEVKELRDRLGQRLEACIYATPDGGWGGDSIRSAGDATALAHQAKELLKDVRSRYKAERIHLVLYAPAAFCLFLGQKLNALGTLATYEKAVGRDYQQSVVLETR